MLNQLSTKANQRLDALMARDQGNVFPACALNVIYKGETVLNAAWGNVEGNPTQVDTLFDLASVTKLFTATAFLSLVSAGKVQLDDSLVSVIPEFGVESPRKIEGGQDPHSKERLAVPAHLEGQTVDPGAVTFRHLLTHTSGLPAWRDVYNAADSAPTPPDEPDPISRSERWARAVRALCGYPFTGKPGGNVSYSDVGLMLLGEALARLHGGSLEEAISERVLQPLGLNNVLFNPVREGGIPREKIAPTEDDPTWRKRRAWGEVHDENACGVGGVAGHAGLFAPARSVATLGRAWLYEPDVFGIDPELAALAKQELAETDGARRGLGFALKAHVGASAGDYFSPNTYGHTGFTGTSLWIDPDKELIVACLTNSVYPGRWHGGTLEFRRDLHDLLAQELEAA